ncbi:FRG domain-containing protein [Accumulibacter sp.]|uniref:FRG domain-containing protein n=1 Tax=Accumulibacter sp. TaxID=2053492 RepID=UPI001AD0D9E9|nr:FRG domain-containing protein [Accumulibacter sp.]MBN8454276.1 FRG domain-containing protein [Accumulibacter sp.]MBO3706585.1 FRG domain-containing protein [Candidatus Accumulibacter conexus]
MNAHTVESFVDFIKHSDVFDLVVHHVVFRGQPIQGNLLPGIARSDPTIDTTIKEQKLLEELKLLGASFLPAATETDLDLLVRAQHFGMKTRLLDWTSNSLAALWFACADPKPGDVFVYALEADNLLLDSTVYTQSPFKAAKTRVLRPRLNNPRVVAQHGWFTLHRYSVKAKRFVSLERNPETAKHLHEYKIPAAKRAELLTALDRHGVSARTLIPDIGGLCQYLNWKQSAT